MLTSLVYLFLITRGGDVIRRMGVFLELSTALHLKFRERQCHGRSIHDFPANCCSHVDGAPQSLFFFAVVSNGVDNNRLPIPIVPTFPCA